MKAVNEKNSFSPEQMSKLNEEAALENMNMATKITKMNPYNMLNWCKPCPVIMTLIVKNKKEMERRRIVELNNHHIHHVGKHSRLDCSAPEQVEMSQSKVAFAYGQPMHSRESSYVKKSKLIKQSLSSSRHVSYLQFLFNGQL